MSESHPQQYDFCDPVTHGVGVQAHHGKTDVYDDLRQFWLDEIGDREDDDEAILEYEPAFASGTRSVVLSSSRWKAGSDPDTQFYSYRLKIRKDGKVPPQALSLEILPQKEGMVYPDGNELKLPHGTGTRLEVQTTYPTDADDVFRRVSELLNEVLNDYDSDGIDRDIAKISKFEEHVRIDRDKMPAMIDTLYHSQRLIGWESMAEIRGEERRTREGWDIWKFDASEWQRLGFAPPSGDYRWALKSYSADGWEHRTDWMHHPKVEAFYGGKLGSAETLPSIEMWDEISDYLSHVVTQHCRWAGVEQSDLIEDPHFAGSEAKTRKFEILEGRREDLRNFYESLDSEVISAIEGSRSDVPEQILRKLTDNPRGVFYDEISEELGVSKETIRHHAKKLENSDLIERIQIGQGGMQLRFKAAAVVDVTNDVLSELHAGETAGEARETDSETTERRRYRSLAELGIPPSQIASAVSDGDLDPDDVRIPEDWSPD